jgi:hypothetical protein
MPRYFVNAPTQALGARHLGSALTPSITRTYAGWSSRGQIVGQPGTQAIPVADPAAVREDVNSLASVGQFSTACAPNVIFPSLYYLVGKQEHAPVSRISDDQMPVPAGRPTTLIPSKQYKQRLGGQRQVTQPQVVQRWKGMRGTPSG